jgi:hypothetical protein
MVMVDCKSSCEDAGAMFGLLKVSSTCVLWGRKGLVTLLHLISLLPYLFAPLRFASLHFADAQPRNRCNSEDQYASFESTTDFAGDLTQFEWIADVESFICMTAK